MITKELFKETIVEIYKFHQKLDLIDKTGLHGISDDLVDVSYEDQLIKLLSSEFDNPEEADEMIAWWIYETEFGNKDVKVIINKGKNRDMTHYTDLEKFNCLLFNTFGTIYNHYRRIGSHECTVGIL